MMIKANGEYLDFNGDVEIESQIKLFEEISTSNGEFSYDIQIQDNGYNRKILGIPRADTIKTIYEEVVSEIIDDTGQSIYKGKLQVNNISGGIITSTFYAGNTEWFAMLSDPISKLPLYRYDVDLTEANIMASWLNDSGIVFPILDAGVMVTRSFKNLKIEDFTPVFYVKTLFNEIFYPKGIKVIGDLIDDPTFQKLTVASNGRSQDDITDRSCYVGKTSTQAIPNEPVGPTALLTFEQESVFPYYDGDSNNFVLTRYTADVKMVVDLEVNVITNINSSSSAGIFFYKNGVEIYRNGLGGADSNTFTDRKSNISLNAGDYLEAYLVKTDGSSFDCTGGYFKVKPSYLYRVFGTSSAPNWTQMEFVSNILRLFNVLPSYNTANKTLTLDLFNKIKEKETVNISEEIVIVDTNFSDFVSNFGKNNYFTYEEGDDEDLREYNISNFISYGSGNLTINNAYIDDSKDLVESDFTSPITYLNGIFDTSMERFNFVALESVEEKTITSVTDASGIPRFNISNADDTFTVGDLVRIEESDVDGYNGDWVVNTVTPSYIVVNGVIFDSSTTATVQLMKHKFTTDDSVYLFINVPNVPVSFFSSNSEFYLEDNTTFNTAAIAYFNLLSNNTNINRVYKQSLAFGAPNNVFNYQITLLETYWPLFSRMLRNPVKLLGSGYLKRTTFDNIKSFLKPVMIKTEETTNLYYLNRNRGYKGSERACELELIKIN